MKKNIFNAVLLVTAGSYAGALHAANAPACFVTFEKEAQVVAEAVEGPGKRKLLVADSKGWSKGNGARVEIQVLLSDQNDRIPVTAYVRNVVDIQAVEGGGNMIHVPVAEPHRRTYWIAPQEGLQINGPTNAPVAFVKCDKQV